MIMWMLIICLAPEFAVAAAITQWKEAREQLAEAKRHISTTRFTLAHAFFANMGGIVLRIPMDRIPALQREAVVGLVDLVDIDAMSIPSETDIRNAAIPTPSPRRSPFSSPPG